MTSFSERQGYIQPKEIRFPDELPVELRNPIFDILPRSIPSAFLWECIEKLFRPYKTGDLPQSSGPIAISREEETPDLIRARSVLVSCQWFRVYDIIEAVHGQLVRQDKQSGLPVEGAPHAPVFKRKINGYFVHAGIGWQLVHGKIVTRGNEAFERTIKIVEQELTNRESARARVQEAINDLSRRPEPDLTGAISHAFAAMECIIGDIAYTPEEIRQGTHHTFGKFLQHHGDLFPSGDLKDGFQCLWKYANNEGSRHGKEGVEPARDEAELIVSLAAALVTYLNRKYPK